MLSETNFASMTIYLFCSISKDLLTEILQKRRKHLLIFLGLFLLILRNQAVFHKSCRLLFQSSRFRFSQSLTKERSNIQCFLISASILGFSLSISIKIKQT